MLTLSSNRGRNAFSHGLIGAMLCTFYVACLSPEARASGIDSAQEGEGPLKVEPAKKFLTAPQSGAFYLQAGDQLVFFCSGTLITPTVVLTAAHCLCQFERLINQAGPHGIYFGLDHKQARQSPVAQRVVRVRSHHGYDPTRRDLEIFEYVTKLKTPREAEVARQHLVRVCGDYEDNEAVNKAWEDGLPTARMLHEEEAHHRCYLAEADAVFTAEELALIEADYHDIALAELIQPLPGAVPAVLLHSGADAIFRSESLYAAGFGKRHHQDGSLVSFGAFHETETVATGHSASEIYTDNGTTTACKGDSGGGLFALTAQGPRLCGVMVRADVLPFSHRCLGRATATSVLSFLPWIETQVGVFESESIAASVCRP